MVTIPSGAFNILNEVIGDLFEKPITVVYPAEKTDCPNCKITTLGLNRSISVYVTGGPIPFPRGRKCPYCNGVGYRDTATSQDIRARIYWNRSKWTSLSAKMNLPEGAIEVLVREIDLPKVLQASYIIPRELNIDDYGEQRFIINGSPKPQGFQQNYQQYYSTFWTKQHG
jgi:hypothetical protein